MSIQDITGLLQQIRAQAIADQALSQKVVESFDDWANKLGIEKKKTTYLNTQLTEAKAQIATLEARVEAVIQDVVDNDKNSKKLLEDNDARLKDAINTNDLNLKTALDQNNDKIKEILGQLDSRDTEVRRIVEKEMVAMRDEEEDRHVGGPGPSIRHCHHRARDCH